MVQNFRLKAFFDVLVTFRRLTPYQARILKALVSFRGTKGCYPSHATLAAETGFSERCVRNALREARLRGWIDWTNERIGRRQTSNRYYFTLTNDYVSSVLDGLRRFKQKTAEISDFFRRHHLPGSPYFYIKQETLKIWNRIEKPLEPLSSWQRLYQENPEAALAQLLAS